MAPPSSGGPIIAEILNIMENADIEKSGFQTPETIHIMPKPCGALMLTAVNILVTLTL